MLPAYIVAPVVADDIEVISPKPYAPLKAKVIKEHLLNYTIDVEFLANANTEENAKHYAIYTSDQMPEVCGDMKERRDIPYTDIGEYKFRFNLKEHQDIVKSLRRYDCVVVYNVVEA